MGTPAAGGHNDQPLPHGAGYFEIHFTDGNHTRGGPEGKYDEFRSLRSASIWSAIAAEKNRGLALRYYIERREAGTPGESKRDSTDLKRRLDERLVVIAARQAIEKAQKP